MENRSLSINILVGLDFDKRAYKAPEKQTLTFSLTNESKETIRVLKWHTPLEGLKSNMFNVEHEGKKAVYLGRVYKRGVPTEDDYLTLQPGQTVKKEVDLTEEYDIVDAGNYSVRYRAAFLHAGVEEAKVLKKMYMTPLEVPIVAVKAKEATFKLEESRLPKQKGGIQIEWLTMMKTLAPSPLSINACSSKQANTIKAALPQAVKIADEARKALSNAPSGDRPNARRYREWFGNYDPARYDNVNTNYDKIWDALANKDLTFTCDDKETAYAYVYPSKPYEIYLGQAFWKAPLAGTDSQGGAILHEMSHFYVVASTDDHVYGQPLCRDLAKNDPDNAADNADSHEYFAENHPKLNM